jgi:protein-S-isoprenylcysteine O-methyltransferase Ste14
MNQEKLAPLFFVLAALATMVIGWFTRSSFQVSSGISKPIGGVIFLVGMIAFTMTFIFLRKAFLGEVTPVTEILITKGPYRWVRHPLYLSMFIALLGIVFALRSVLGMVFLFLMFLPTVVYRARLEERALFDKLGKEWTVYAQKTSFLIPFLW